MQRKGPWSDRDCRSYLDEARIPIRLACNGRSGHPVIASLWFAPLGSALWCATQRTARVVSLLEADARCAFEIAGESPPYRGVRGQAVATIEPARGEEILRRLIDRYLGNAESDFARWLLERTADEIAIRIEPTRIVSWDFTRRMSGS